MEGNYRQHVLCTFVYKCVICSQYLIFSEVLMGNKFLGISTNNWQNIFYEKLSDHLFE